MNQKKKCSKCLDYEPKGELYKPCPYCGIGWLLLRDYQIIEGDITHLLGGGKK